MLRRVRLYALSVVLSTTAGIILYGVARRSSAFECPGCNFVVILIDTLRADHLPFYGYKRDTAPFLTSLAAKSTVFDRAFSSSSWTAPATASIFTSLYPSQHGVVTGFAASRKLQQENEKITMNRIPKEVVTLGEFMRAQNFTTAAVADNLNIGEEMGFNRGFEHFAQFRYKGAEAINAEAVKFLEQMKTRRPYFLYLHYMEPHSPHYEREPFYSNCIEGTDKNKRQLMQCGYDSEIRYLDDFIAKLFADYGWLENSVVVVLADHGEEFWEHGRTGHGRTLYSEVIRVPLLIYHPKLKAGRVGVNVNTIDLLPTLAQILGAEALPDWQGKSLFETQSGEGGNRVLLSEKLRHPAMTKQRWWKRAVVKKDWHYIQTEEPESVTSRELFDLQKDPLNAANVYSQFTAAGEELSRILSAFPHDAWQKFKESFDVEVDAEMLERLKTLGYVD